METKKLLKNYIDERTSKVNSYPSIIKLGIDTISGEVPFSLKLAITLSELITFASHTRQNIILYDGTLVPVNAIVFALSASGTSKDRSLHTLRKSLNEAYNVIEGYRIEAAKERAVQRAVMEHGEETNWQQYYKKPKPLQAGLGTVEGLLQHFSDVSKDSWGAGSITTSEIGSELQSNPSISDIIKVISVAYDLGKIPAKIVKAKDNQTDPIEHFPVNALFFGSQEAILFDNLIKGKFKLIFNTQLARRSLFTFTPETVEKPPITSIDELYELREKERQRVLAAQEKLRAFANEIVLSEERQNLEISPEANKLFDVYLEYNNIVSDELPNRFPISKLARKHKQWLALKLSGAYAILEKSSVITEELYSYAINTVELVEHQLRNFEVELVKEPYEQLVDFCHHQTGDKEEYFISLHDLRKMQYITGHGGSKSKVEELCSLANSCDKKGSYAVESEGIKFTPLNETDIVGVSYIIHETDLEGQKLKNYMTSNSSEGFTFFETDFADLQELLKENAAYCSFQYKDGIRHRDNVIGGTKFVVLDIDKSMLTDEEAHILLDNYNHLIARTSDPDNPFKFRVLLELDSSVDVSDEVWKQFLSEIGYELGFVVDRLPKSQMFLSFANRNVLSQLDAEPVKVKPLLDRAVKKVNTKQTTRKLPAKPEANRMLKDTRTTFDFAFTAEPGERSIMIYRALAYAIDLGADEEYIKNLANEINDYLSSPMDKQRLERTLIKPAIRRIK